MNVLVTGGRGFVGGFIARSLSTKHNVLAPSRQELDLQNLPEVEQYFRNHSIHAVIHCALSGREVLSSTDPQYLSDGLLMFRNLWLQRKYYGKFIHLGTAYELDLNVNNSLVHEDEFINQIPLSSYGYAKNIAARIIYQTPEFYNLRLFGVFHETESEKRFFKRVISQDEITINNDQWIDYMYLPDIIPMISCILADRAEHFDINMVYPTKYRLSEMAHYLCDQLGISKDKIKVAGYTGCDLTGLSNRLASYDLPLIGLKQGLRNYK